MPDETPNIHRPSFDEPREHPGFRCRRALIGRQAGGERLGLSLWELPPGEAAYPYHHHLGEEELVIVLEGTLALRTPGGWRELEEGEVVAFPRGEAGAHQLVNRGERTARFLAASTSGDPDDRDLRGLRQARRLRSPARRRRPVVDVPALRTGRVLRRRALAVGLATVKRTGPK